MRRFFVLNLKRMIPMPVLNATEIATLQNAQLSELSSPQQVVWLDQVLHPEAAIYNIGLAWQIQGEVDPATLRQAVNLVANGNDALRIVLCERDGMARQHMVDSVDVDVPVIDFSGQDNADARARAYMADAFAQPFDLGQGPLWNTELVRVDATCSYWLQRYHHLVIDGYGISLIVHAVAQAYNGLLAGAAPAAPGPSYLDFVAEDQQYLASSRYARDREFWCERFAQLPEPLFASRAASSNHGATVAPSEQVCWSIERARYDHMQQFAVSNGFSMTHLMLAAISAYFARVSGSGEIIIGTPVHNRGNARQKQTLGMFSSSSPIGIAVDRDASFMALMTEVAAELKRCYRHQRFPIAELNRALKLTQSGRHQLYDVSLSTMSFDGSDFFGDAPTKVIPMDHRVERTPLAIAIRDHHAHDDVLIEFLYSTDYLSAPEVETIKSGIVHLLDAAIAQPELPVKRLPLMSAAERALLLVGFNATGAAYPQDALIHQLFETQAASTPDAMALVAAGESLSYQQLNERANRLAHRLLALGVQADDRVAVCMERGGDMVIGLLAILKAGAGYVPLDPSYPADRLAFMLADCAPAVLLTQSALSSLLPPGAAPLLAIDCPQERALVGAAPFTNPDSVALGLTAASLAYVIYTSGSTGLPKGVMIEHRNTLNLIGWAREAFSTVELAQTLFATSINFDLAVFELFVPLCCGATVTVVRDALDAAGRGDQPITLVNTVPSAIAAMLALEQVPASAQVINLAGEPLKGALVERIFASTPVPAVANLYGPSETTTYSTWVRMDRASGFVPHIGRPVANTQVYILDAGGEPVPLGVPGEIFIGGAGVARGYMQRPDLTAERFLADPFSTEANARMYRTGDLGRWLPDGNIVYLGRNDFQVKIRGFRIELGEIEARLAACDGVREAHVIARPDHLGETRLVAYVTAHEGALLSVSALRTELGATLAGFMIPAVFVMLDEFPLTPNGKLDRKALPDADDADAAAAVFEVPQGPLETSIAAIWQDLLGLEQVGRHDHFFDLGGHSLLAIQLIARLRKEAAIEVSLRDLFNAPTLAEFAIVAGKAGRTELAAIGHAPRDAALPLSFAQQRLWFLDQLDQAAGAAYHMPAALRLCGVLNTAALAATLERIVERHESLRTTFVNIDGAPVQRIGAGDGFTLRQRDLSTLAATEQELVVLAAAADEASAPFALAAGPLFRAQLLRLAPQEHVLLITLHHIISDGWSISVLVREISTLYAAFRQGLPDPLPPLGIQYPDYALWQREYLQGDVLVAQSAFWKAHLDGAPALLELPTDRPRPPVQSYAGGHVSLALPAALTGQLQALGQRHGVTLFMTLFAAWTALLARVSGQHDIVVGTPVANRQRAEVESLIGFFVNTLALRVRFGADPSVAELLEQVKTGALGAFEHAELPFEQVVEALQPVRSMSYSPLFQTMFILNNTPGGNTLELDGLAISAIEHERGTTQFDLSLTLAETPAGLSGSLEYATDLFDQSTIERLAVHFQTLLSAMASGDEQRVSALPLMDTAQRAQLAAFNDTAIAFPQDVLIHQAFEARVAQCPQAIALVFEDQELSYAELNTRANQLAHRLLALGVQPDDRVALCVQRSVEMVVSLLAIMKAGGAYVPLDPSLPADRIAYMFDNSAPVAVLTQSALATLLPATSVPMLVLDSDAEAALLAGLDSHNPCVPTLTSANLAYVIYTSGSTGMPKGVMNEHHAVMNRLQWMQEVFKLGETDRVLQKTPYSFDVSVWEFFNPLLAGARLVVARPDGHKSPQYLAQLVQDAGVTIMHFVPSMLQAFVEQCSGWDSATLKRVFCSGEALPVALRARFRASWPNVELHNLYGPTEAAIEVTWFACSDDRWLHLSPIGRPTANTEIHILDALGQAVPVGVAGEIHIGGVQVARGYLNRDDLTAERFIADPFSTHLGARLYKTGDVGRWLPDGNVDYLGRNDFQVKIRGFRIELGEIEAQLVACNGVREAVVVAREDQPGDKRLVAYLVAETGRTPEASQLRAQLSANLTDYMIPSAFIVLDAFPISPNGKLDRTALPAPDRDDVASGEYVAPQGAAENAIAALWQELLGLEQVGRHDHFFELGGHSLMAIGLLARMRDMLGVEISLRDLFAEPTLAGFAKLASGANAARLATIDIADRSLPLPLSLAQQRLWFLDRLDHAASASYHMPAALRLVGQLNHAALRATLNAIVARHESLRTTFVSVNGEPTQLIAAADIGCNLRQRDCTDQIERMCTDEARAPFDLATGPLLRTTLLRVAPDEHILLVTMHHIVSDGWSIGVLVKEVSALYAAFSQGLPDPLAPLAIQYPDYAAWQRNWLHSEQKEQQANFWRQHLQGAPALLELSTDRPRPQLQNYDGASVVLDLSPELNAALRELARSQGTTLFMTLLAGWALTLARLSGQDDIVIGTPVANRQRAEVEELIGFFVNTLALRVRLDGNPSVARLLAQIKADTVAAYDHQDLPFDQVVEAVNPPRSMAHSAIFQTMLTLNNIPNSGVLNLPGLTVSPVSTELTTTHFDLSLTLMESASGLAGELQYATALFDEDTAQRIAAYFTTALAAMTAAPEHAIDSLNVLPATERRKLLLDFNDSAVAYPQDQLLHALFAQQAATRPAAMAVVSGTESISYGELNRRANAIAHKLVAQGVVPDDRVALCVDRSIDMIVGLFAILKAGAGYVPMDPLYPQDRLAFMLEDCAPALVLTQSWLALPPTGAPVLHIDIMRDASEEAAPQIAGLTPASLAYVIYTSGSTGKPKGVAVEHASAVNLWRALADTVLCDAPQFCNVALNASFSFDGSLKGILQLLSGHCLHLIAQDVRSDGAALNAFLREQQIDVLDCTPTQLGILIATGLDAPGAPGIVLIGGEAIAPSLWQRLQASACTQFFNVYGPTECTVDSTVFRITGSTCGPTIGRAIPNARIYLLDRHLQPVPLGAAGELYIGGAGVARGYLHQSQLTAERFIADPFSTAPGARLYRTGDLGRYQSDGTIDYLGRNDFQVKVRGFRIELGEIEAALRACSGVRDAVVIAREDHAGDKRLVAYIITADAASCGAASLRAALLPCLPEYMVPSAFVTLDAFPLNPSGKLDRKALPAPDLSALATRAYSAPQGPVETTLAAIWQELMDVPQVGRDDHFFELGGHSLMVISMIEHLRRHGLTLDVRSVFAAPTLAALAAVVGGAKEVTSAVPPNLIVHPCSAITPDMLTLVTLGQHEIDAITARVPGGAANVQDIYPLAPLQTGILFHHMLGGPGDPYLQRFVLSFDARPQLERFIDALQAVIDRHDILRTAVLWRGLKDPVQVVLRQAALPQIAVVLEEGDAVAQMLARVDPRTMRIDLERAPLLAAHVGQEASSGRCHLVLLNHHMVCDHVTLELIVGEIRLMLEGHADRLPRALPYRNFVAQTVSIDHAEQESFFRKQLAGIDAPTAPFGLLDVRGDGAGVQVAELPLPGPVAQQVRSVARKFGVTPAVLFHVAWAQVLGLCSGRDDVVFGTVLFGRMHGSDGAERVLGMFINTLPVRVALANASVQTVLTRTYEQLSDLLRHEQASLALAQRCSDVSAPLPLFTALFNYRHTSHIDGDGLGMQEHGVHLHATEERVNYPFGVSVDDLGEDFKLVAQCDGADAAQVAHMLALAVEQLANALDAEPSKPIGKLEFLPPAARKLVLESFNDTAVTYPQDQLVHQLFEAHATLHPHALAVGYGDTTLSYADLNRRANQLAHHLITLGVGPDRRVAICAERSVELVVAVMAVFKAGGAYVPMDPAYPAERLATMLHDSAPVALLTQSRLAGGLPELGLPLVVLDDAALYAACPDTNPVVPGLGNDSLAYVIYTSGSTGTPKGVANQHGQLCNYARSQIELFGLVPASRVLQFVSFSFDVFVSEFTMALCSGASLFMASPSDLLAGAPLVATVSRHAITHLSLPSAVLAALPSDASLAPLQVLVTGGDVLPPALARHWSARHRMFNAYGPTETTVCAAAHHCGPDEDGIVPIGRPLPNTQVYILDNHQRPVPCGAQGELYIGGAQLARGYLDRADLTAERFVANPFDGASRLYRTGDLGRWNASGEIEFLGRADAQLKIRGFRIEAGEIEAKLLACDGVREAVVIAREDQPGDKRLVAYLTAHVGAQLQALDLRRQLSASLADYMVPGAFVVLDALPMTPNGKLDRKALPAPDAGAIAARPFEAPQSDAELALASIWQELLGLETVSRNDHFFELGGHSLMAVQLMGRIREHCHVELSMQVLFDRPVLGELAAAIEASQYTLFMGADEDKLRGDLDALTEDELLAILAEESVSK